MSQPQQPACVRVWAELHWARFKLCLFGRQHYSLLHWNPHCASAAASWEQAGGREFPTHLCCLKTACHWRAGGELPVWENSAVFEHLAEWRWWENTCCGLKNQAYFTYSIRVSHAAASDINQNWNLQFDCNNNKRPREGSFTRCLSWTHLCSGLDIFDKNKKE